MVSERFLLILNPSISFVSRQKIYPHETQEDLERKARSCGDGGGMNCFHFTVMEEEKKNEDKTNGVWHVLQNEKRLGFGFQIIFDNPKKMLDYSVLVSLLFIF